jgi:hypothetical protein
MAEGIDTLHDYLVDIALDRLARMRVRAEDRTRIAPTVASVAMEGIQRAKEAGMLHDEDTATWTPKFLEIIARILVEVLAHGNPKLLVQCFDFSFGLGLEGGISEQAIAEQHGMSRSNVSKICVGITEKYGVPPSRGMRSIPTREKYSVRQLGRRAKPSPEMWRHTQTLLAAFRPVTA